MGFELKMALRYLLSSWRQSALLVSGVAVGVVVFTFMAALMNGLGVRLTDDITGNVAHVTLEPELRVPRTFMASPAGRALFAVQPGHDVRPVIRTYRNAVEIAARMRGVRVAVPEVVGNATLSRGAKEVAVAVTGVEPRSADEIAPLGRNIVLGRLDLGSGNVVIGSRLAADLGVDVGDRVILQASRSRGQAGTRTVDAVVVVRGIFTLGVLAIDERVAYLELAAAKRLLARVGLSHRAAFPASKLSGGQKQRVAVARALMMRPELAAGFELMLANLKKRLFRGALLRRGIRTDAGSRRVLRAPGW